MKYEPMNIQPILAVWLVLTNQNGFEELARICHKYGYREIRFTVHSVHTVYKYGLPFIRFTASAFRKLPSIYVFSYFPFGFEGRIWDLIVSVPDHCLSFYFIRPIGKWILFPN